MSPAQEADIRAWTAAQLRCRKAYYGDQTPEQLRRQMATKVRKNTARKTYQKRTET